ncbi:MULTISPECIES: hypothetical protein [unclassified Microcoleus]
MAGNTAEFTSDEGLHYMNLLYQQFAVSVLAMCRVCQVSKRLF